MDQALQTNLAMAFALPLTREEFFADLTESSGKSFVAQWVSSFPGFPVEDLWREYSYIAAHAQALANELESRVGIRLAATFEEWKRLMETARTVSLFAHWSVSEKTIEFRDGAVSLDDFIASIPDEFGGTLDFTICHSTGFLEVVKSARPRSTVLANRKRASLRLRLAIYRQAVELALSAEVPLGDAMREIQLKVLKSL